MTTSAIVVTYHTPAALLDQCLTSLRHSGLNASDIIIHDNTHQNTGFAAGANAAAARAKSDLLLFLNPDAALAHGALTLAVNYLQTHPRVAIVGLLLMSPSGQPENFSFGPKVTPLTLFTRKFNRPAIPTQPTPVGWVSGGALIIRRPHFARLGGFDPRFFLYWEDIDLCRRVHQAGHQVVLMPAAFALHQRGASLSDSKLKTGHFDRSADKYFRKYYPKPICFLLRLCRFLYRLFFPQVY